MSGDRCEWDEDEDGNWSTSCDHMWMFAEGGPADNECVFCTFCGKKIAQCSYQPPPDEDEVKP